MSSTGPSLHLCSYRRGMNWHTFKYLDKRLDELSRYITFDRKNKDIWSESLADLLILTGSATDTFFRDMGECPNIKAELNYQNVESRVKSRYWDVNNFRQAYNPIYELSENKVFVPFSLRDYGEVQPFIEFKENTIPVWWDAYNHLKHSFYRYLEEATLENVINSLGALLILNALHKCSKEYLALSGILKQEYGNLQPQVFAEAVCKSNIGYPTKSPPFSLKSYLQTLNFRFDLRPDENITNVFK